MTAAQKLSSIFDWAIHFMSVPGTPRSPLTQNMRVFCLLLSGGRGGKRSHKGQKRHFTSEDEIRAQQEKEEKEKAWRVSLPFRFQAERGSDNSSHHAVLVVVDRTPPIPRLRNAAPPPPWARPWS